MDFKIFIRNNTELAEVKDLTIEADSTVKNSYSVFFDKEQSVDGIMIYFDKEDLPKSELPEQDGLVRVKELLMITPDGEELTFR